MTNPLKLGLRLEVKATAISVGAGQSKHIMRGYTRKETIRVIILTYTNAKHKKVTANKLSQ